jgi:hypothetical protein
VGNDPVNLTDPDGRLPREGSEQERQLQKAARETALEHPKTTLVLGTIAMGGATLVAEGTAVAVAAAAGAETAPEAGAAAPAVTSLATRSAARAA